MNLIKEYLGSIAGVHIFAIISMLIFLITFVLMILHTFSLRKDEVRKYSRLPLEEDEVVQD
jgi:hypothetical protein